MHFLQLPLDIILLLATMLDPVMIIILREVCSRFARTIPKQIPGGAHCDWCYLYEGAARYGYRSILRYLKKQKRITGLSRLGEFAALSGDVKTLVLVLTFGCELSRIPMYFAVRSGSIELIQYLRSMNHPWHSLCCEAAIDIKNLKLLEWLRENGCPWGFLWMSKQAVTSRTGRELRFLLRQNPALNYAYKMKAFG
jgi:hypothetical protein